MVHCPSPPPPPAIKKGLNYRKIPIISPGLQLPEGLFSEGLIIEWKFAFQNGLALTIKQSKTLRKQPKTT